MNLSRAQANLAALREQARRAFDEAGGVCWKCHDTGALLNGDPCPRCPAGMPVRARLAQRQADDYARMLVASGMPAEMRARNLTTYPRPGPVTRALARYVNEWDGHGLILTGALGTGKSSLLAAVVRALALDHPGRIAWYTAAGYLAELRGAMGEPERYARLLERGRASKYFVLDDIGRANVGEWVSETLFMVITARYDANLPTFATSNYALGSDLAARLGEHGAAIVDRLVETCYSATVTGASMRKRLNLDIS